MVCNNQLFFKYYPYISCASSFVLPNYFIQLKNAVISECLYKQTEHTMNNLSRTSRLLAKTLLSQNRHSLQACTQLLVVATQPARAFHPSAQLNSMYEKRARDKAKRFAGKKKFELKTIELKTEMTVKQLADAMDKPVSHVFSCLDQIGYSVRNRRDSFLLKDASLIIQIIQLSGMR